ncbi:MAG: cytochrome d ubiquinol oxidase subunit II [Prevotella sp.]|nr:cytochrome d ubiquinol oxidase subunit II [Prevotella sp.]MCM1074218.1 cytochrome d ubiquinol oxidase subunit II [Ruminococcus sp.]
MTELALYQNYWWLIICVLGAALVFMLFVLGGQSMLLGKYNETDKQLMVNSLGRKWELTFTTLVVFGGAFFASFPLYYSTSFGGAYWLWMAILFCFVFQAFSYEFRRKKGNLYGTCVYDFMLFIGGALGCILLGAAVGMMFTGAEFTVTRGNLAEGTNPVISEWASTHGFEVICSWECLLLGFTIFFLARTLAALYFINNIRTDGNFEQRMRRAVFINGLIFALLFIAFTAMLILNTGWQADNNGDITAVPYLYLKNFIGMWWWGILFLLGVVLALVGIGVGALSKSRGGIWYAGVGVILVVVSLLAVAGYNSTAYLPSLIDANSSLTLANSSSSLFTLKVMSIVSLLVPFVLAYIWYVWRKMNAKPLDSRDVSPNEHQY